MKQIPFIAVLLLSMTGLNADTHLQEQRLLKSWGLQFDVEGRLRLHAQPAERPPYQAWRPDLSAYRLNQADKSSQTLNPVVISSRRKPE